MAKGPTEFRTDPSRLTDADLAELSKLSNAYDAGGEKALLAALRELAIRDPIRYVTVVAALSPLTVREAFKHQMAQRGVTTRELEELLSKLKNKPAAE